MAVPGSVVLRPLIRLHFSSSVPIHYFYYISLTIIISNAYAYYGPGIVLNILHAPPHLCREHMIIPIFQVGKLSSQNLHKLLRIVSFIKFQTFNLDRYVSNNLCSSLVHYTASLKVFTV